MKKVFKERLLKLASFLRELPKENFDLEIIMHSDEQLDNCSAQKALSCNTVACAMGWCPTIFPRSFRWGKFVKGYLEGNKVYARVVLKNKPKIHNFDAASSFFGISRKESNFLFDPWYYDSGKKGAKAVARRIEAFVNGDKDNYKRSLARRSVSW